MGTLERFTIEMAFICASEDKAGKEQKRSHSGLRRVFVTQAADAATSRWATDIRKMLERVASTRPARRAGVGIAGYVEHAQRGWPKAQ